MNNKLLLAGTLMLACGVVSADTTQIKLGEFSTGSLKGWESKAFSGQTQYQIKQQGNLKSLSATATKSASGLGVKKRIDLTKTPFLNWSWRVDKPLPALNEKTKAGDDYAARLYVIIDGGLFIWKTRALNYVWSSKPSKGTKWNNAFAPRNARMLAVRDSRDGPGKWVTEKQNVAADFKNLYGFVPRFIDGVALMTDTDNSGGTAAASYGDIFFSAQ